MGSKQLWSLLVLNSAMLAVACSTYFSFCGNGLTVSAAERAAAAAAAGGGPLRGSYLPGSYLRRAICSKWLHPVPTSQYPSFASWMLYGEGAAGPSETAAGNGSETAASPARAPSQYILIDQPLDGLGILSVPAGDVISPVFTLWLTLLLLFVANAVADHAAAGEMHASHIGELRRMLSTPDLAQLARGSSSNLAAMDLAGTPLPPGGEAAARGSGGGGAGGGGAGGGGAPPLARARRSRSMEMQREAGWRGGGGGGGGGGGPALASFNPRQLLLSQELASSAVQLLLDQTSRLGSRANTFLEQHGLPRIQLDGLLPAGGRARGPAPRPTFQPMARGWAGLGCCWAGAAAGAALAACAVTLSTVNPGPADARPSPAACLPAPPPPRCPGTLAPAQTCLRP